MLVSTRTAVALIVLATVNVVALHAQEVVEQGAFKDWAVFVDKSAPDRFCFITSEPKESAPSNAKRDKPRTYISAWPKDGIKSEVSFRMGFPVKADGGMATVGEDEFEVFAKGDRVYIKDPTQELKMVDAMKKGSILSVRVSSERGTVVTDTYSLSGITAAMDKMQKTCF